MKIFKYEAYSDWSRLLAKTKTVQELEKEMGIANSKREKLAKSHFDAVKKTSSMSSNSQRRAQSRNSMVGNYEKYNAYKNALEIHEYYPEKCKK